MINLSDLVCINASDVNRIKTDSNAIKAGDIFIAINAGNRFVEHALEKGARYVITERQDLKKSDTVIVVENSVKRFQEIAKAYRAYVAPKVVAITGSNGKTSVKDISALFLAQHYQVHATKGNFNNLIGVPITICSMPLSTEVLVLELGMSEPGEISCLAELARPDIAVITNIGDSHLEFLGSREKVRDAKLEILPYSKSIILNADDVLLRPFLDKALTFLVAENSLENLNKCATITAENIVIENGLTQFDVVLKGDKKLVKTALLGKAAVSNVIAALLISNCLEVPIDKCIACISKIQISPMRMELGAFEKAIIINDAYNASPVSTQSAIETVYAYFKDMPKILVLGDMLELGEGAVNFHREILQNLTTQDFYAVYCVGEIYNTLKESFDDTRIHFIKDRKALKQHLEKIAKITQCVMLFKGSRGLKLEEIIPTL